MHRFDWDDLRYILSVAEAGSLAAAARQLGVNHTTVLRRINAFERSHGIRLFDRLPTGYALTAEGEQLLAAARSMSEVVDDLERRLKGRDLRLEGSIRLSTTDTLMASILPPVLGAFTKQHPSTVLEISVTNVIADLTKREADVAIRAAGTPPETLVGRKLADVGWSLYAAVDDDPIPDLADANWIAPDDSLVRSAYARWLRANYPEARVVARSDSFVAMRDLARQHIGVVALPCYLGDTCPDLMRIQDTVLADVTNELWIITHDDLRRTARIAAFLKFTGERIASLQPLIAGHRQPPFAEIPR